MTTTMTKLLDLISLESFLMATVCIFLIIHIFNLRNFYTGTPPGPWGFPIFGYLFFINNQPFKQFVSLSKKYGDVFSLNIGSRYVVVINHYDVIKEAFIKHGDIFAGKPTEGLAAEFGDYKSVFVTEGNLWKDQRRFLVNSMKDFGFGRTSMEGYIQEEAKDWTIELGTHLDLTSFVVEVNNQGIDHNIELGSHFTFMFLMGYILIEKVQKAYLNFCMDKEGINSIL